MTLHELIEKLKKEKKPEYLLINCLLLQIEKICNSLSFVRNPTNLCDFFIHLDVTLGCNELCLRSYFSKLFYYEEYLTSKEFKTLCADLDCLIKNKKMN